MKSMQSNVSMILAIACFLVSQYAHADKATTCSNCNVTQAANAALAVTEPHAYYYVYVMDFPGETLWKFLAESTTELGQVWKYATLVETESGAQDYFDDWVAWKNQSQPEFEVPTSTGIFSAYDLPGHTAKQGDLIDYAVETQSSYFEAFNIVVSHNLSFYGGLANVALDYANLHVDISIEVTFSDGSILELIPHMSEDSNGDLIINFDIDESSLVDSDGNSIPFTSAQVGSASGSFSGGTAPNNATRWLNLMNYWGLYMNQSGNEELSCDFSCEPGGGVCTLSCS